MPFDSLAPRTPRSAALPRLWASLPVARGFPVGLALPMALLGLLELAVRLGWVPGRLLPPPSEVARTLVELAHNGLAGHVLVSVLRVATGFALGAVLGVGVASIVGLSRRAEALFDPSLQALRAIPSLAWVPLLLLWLGIDELPKVALIALGSFFPVYLNLVSSIHNVDRKWVEVGQMYGLSGASLVRRILLPASLPGLFTGLRAGLGLSWMFLVAAELIAATRGIGYLLSDGRETGRADIVVAAIVLLAVLGKVSDSALKAVERRLLRWRDVYSTRGEA